MCRVFACGPREQCHGSPGRGERPCAVSVVLTRVLRRALGVRLWPCPGPPSSAECVSFLLLSAPTEEQQHPWVTPGKQFADSLPRTEQYWVKPARPDNARPDAEEERVLGIARASARAAFHDST